MKNTVFIVDDEKEGRAHLTNFLARYCPHLELLGEAGDIKNAIILIEGKQPEILLLDINLPDGLSFEILGKISYQPKVIFITAYDDYVLKALRLSAVDYLLKPFEPLDLIESLSKAVKDLLENGHQHQINSLLENQQKVKKIVLPTAQGYEMVAIDEIIRCEADNTYTTFYLTDSTKRLVTKTLKLYEELLVDHNFFRCHQSHLVNLNFVKLYYKGEGGALEMTDGSSVDVSRRKKDELIQLLDQRFLK